MKKQPIRSIALLAVVMTVIIAGCKDKNDSSSDENFKQSTGTVEESISSEKRQEFEKAMETIADPERAKRLNQSMMGIYLGETVDDLKKRFKVEPIDLQEQAELGIHQDPDDPTVELEVVHTSKNIKHCEVKIYCNKIYEIDITFQDGSDENYKAIRNKLKNKYKDDYSETYGNADFGIVVDGIRVDIYLGHDSGYKLTFITYKYKGLADMKEEEMIQKKSAKISEQL